MGQRCPPPATCGLTPCVRRRAFVCLAACCSWHWSARRTAVRCGAPPLSAWGQRRFTPGAIRHTCRVCVRLDVKPARICNSLTRVHAAHMQPSPNLRPTYTHVHLAYTQPTPSLHTTRAKPTPSLLAADAHQTTQYNTTPRSHSIALTHAWGTQHTCIVHAACMQPTTSLHTSCTRH